MDTAQRCDRQDALDLLPVLDRRRPRRVPPHGQPHSRQADVVHEREEGGAAVRRAERVFVRDADREPCLGRPTSASRAGESKGDSKPLHPSSFARRGGSRCPSLERGAVRLDAWRRRSGSTASAGSGATSTGRGWRRARASRSSPSTTWRRRTCSRTCSSTTRRTASLDQRGRATRRTRSRSTATPFRVLSERDASALPWKEMGVDVVVESTGLFTDREGASQHLDRRRGEGRHLRARHGPGHHDRPRRQRRHSTTPTSTTSSRTPRARRTRSGRWRRSCSTPSGSSRAS